MGGIGGFGARVAAPGPSNGLVVNGLPNLSPIGPKTALNNGPGAWIAMLNQGAGGYAG